MIASYMYLDILTGSGKN